MFSAVELRARANAILIAKLASLTLLACAAIAAATLAVVFFVDTRQGSLPPNIEWPPAGSANRQVVEAYRHFRQTINDARQGCEGSSNALDLTIRALDQDQANVFDARRAAEYAQRACAAAYAAVSAIPGSPGMPPKSQVLAGRVIADCRASMRARAEAAGEIVRILSTHQSSAAIKALEQAALRGERNAGQCSASLRILGGAAGIDLARLRE